MTRFLAIAIVLMLLIWTALPAPAGPLKDRRDFDAFAEAAAPLAGGSYAYARCAGLYRSVRLHAGRAALGEARWDYAGQVEAALTRKAALTRASEQSQPWPSAQVQAQTDVDALARLYLTRYEGMIALTGLPWSQDPLWRADNVTCGGLLDDL